MKNKVVLAGLVSVLMTANVNAQNNIEDNTEIVKQDSAIKFGEYVESRPKETFLFETSTRMVNFENKTMEIMDVSEPQPMGEFDRTLFVEVKPFNADFSGIPLIEGLFDKNSYPQKRISEECSLMIEEYGLYLQGQFIDEKTFKVLKLKPKKIHENNLTGYCDYKEKFNKENHNTFEKVNDFNERSLKGDSLIELY